MCHPKPEDSLRNVKIIAYDEEEPAAASSGEERHLADAVKRSPLARRAATSSRRKKWALPDQRRCVHRQGDRARGPVREDRRRAGQGGRQRRPTTSPGDGTTTATVLARRWFAKVCATSRPEPDRPQARHREGRRQDPRVAESAKEVETKEQIAATAGISAGDQTIGDLIAEAMDKVGNEGVITVEESNTFGLQLELTEGMRFDKGYIRVAS